MYLCVLFCLCRLHDRQKRTERDSLLQGVQLPQQITVARESLMEARDLPSQPIQYGHTLLEFQEPENREGETKIRQRHSARTPAPVSHTISHTGGGDAFIAKHGAAEFPVSSDNSSMEDWSSTHHLPPAHNQSWSSFLQAPLQHSQGWSSTYQLPPTHSQGWSSIHHVPVLILSSIFQFSFSLSLDQIS